MLSIKPSTLFKSYLLLCMKNMLQHVTRNTKGEFLLYIIYATSIKRSTVTINEWKWWQSESCIRILNRRTREISFEAYMIRIVRWKVIRNEIFLHTYITCMYKQNGNISNIRHQPYREINYPASKYYAIFLSQMNILFLSFFPILVKE